MSEYSTSPSRPGSPVGFLPDPSQSAVGVFRFQWDAASRKRGPKSVSETTEGRGGGDYFGLTPRVDIPNTFLPLGALPSDWSSSTRGFNAISTVLNNPRRSQAPPKAHSSLPHVAPAILPRVKRKDFDSYLRVVTPEWERFVQSAQLDHDGPSPLDGSSTPRSSTDALLTPRTANLGKLLTPLNTVPAVFFDSEFDLGNPDIFNAVTEQKEDDDDASDPSSLSYSLPLLEKLSHHADTIEQHLVREISLRSTSFFAALTNLQDLQTESEGCLERLSKLRGLLRDIDENGAKRGLALVRKESKLVNLGSVCEGVKEMSAVVEMLGVAKGLVGAGQWDEALQVIESIEVLWEPPSPADSIVSHNPTVRRQSSRKANGGLPSLPPTPESPLPEHEDPGGKKSSLPSIRLSALEAFSSLPSHLRALTMEITSSLTSDLVGVLRVDLLERVSSDHRHSESVCSMNMTLTDRLRPLLHGLLRTKGTREAILSWREAMAMEFVGIMKHHLPSFDPDEGDKNPKNATSGLPNHLRSKTHAGFFAIITEVYGNYMNAVQGLQVQNSILLEVLGGHQPSELTADLPSLQEELSDILSAAADLSNKFTAKVIGYRSEQHAQLDLPSFLALFNESWNFMVQCEVICRRMIVGLRGTILSQAKLFLQTFHQSHINQSAKLVEDEQWNQIEVPLYLQHLADVLVDSAVRDSPELIIQHLPSATTFPENGNSLSLSPSSPYPPKADLAPSGSSSKCIRIEDRPYFCVSATGAVLGLMLDYLRLVVNLPTLNTETMGRIIEFLKAFNSRTCQVVLGAGAMRSAGLKNITAKHLALASQSLSIMVALIPYIRETFRRHLNPNQAVMLVEFDKLKRDFQEHQNEIHSKLIAIMGDRITAHIKSLQAVNWEAPKQGGAVNDYMELLVKETVTLHKVLSRYLSAPTVEYVMSQVFAAINHRLSEEYTNIEMQSQEAKDRMLEDARFLHQKLSVLKNVNAPTNMLETLVGEKLVPRKTALSTLRAIPSPNERIKGFLSRRESTKDKPLPTPEQVPSGPGSSVTLSGNITPYDGNESGDWVVPLPRSSSRAGGPEVSQVGHDGTGGYHAGGGDDLPSDGKIGENSAVTDGATMPIPQAGDSCDDPNS
ncbi:Vps54-like protein-domain-containing protein [Scleroderma citrinum]